MNVSALEISFVFSKIELNKLFAFVDSRKRRRDVERIISFALEQPSAKPQECIFGISARRNAGGCHIGGGRPAVASTQSRSIRLQCTSPGTVTSAFVMFSHDFSCSSFCFIVC